MGVQCSILLPVRDAAPWLAEALESCLAQSHTDFECIVVDDASTDASSDIAADYARRDPRIRVVRAPGDGLAIALEFGRAECRGEFIARMDADDVMLSRRLELQLAELRRDPRLAVVDARVEFFDENPVQEGMRLYGAWVNRILEHEDFARSILRECPVVHPAATLRASALAELGGYRQGAFPEDFDLWLRLFAAGWRFRKLPEVLLRQRDHAQRATRVGHRYARAAFRERAVAWVLDEHLEGGERVVLWGAGRGGRPWLKALRAGGVDVVAVVDIDPKRIGRSVHGVPCVEPGRLESIEAERCYVAVGARDAAPKIARALAELRPDWREGRDWWHVVT